MSLQVLIVDDSKVMRTMVRRVLQMSGLALGEVHEAGDGDEALRVSSQRSFDLFIVDVNMPGVNGVELVGELRRRESSARTPVIVISAGVNAARLEHLHDLKAHFIRKPFSAELLAETIRLAVGEADDELSKALMEATVSALEQLCFAVPEGLAFDATLDASGLPGAYVGFEGMRPGGLALWIEPAALSTLASNMLGTEEAPSSADAMDALREVARVICVHVHTRLFGDDAVDDLQMPRALLPGEPGIEPGLREAARVHLHIDGGRVAVAAYLRPRTH